MANNFKSNLEAIGDFLHTTEGLLTSLITIGVISGLIYFNRINAQNQALIGVMGGGGLLYGTSSKRRQDGSTTVEATDDSTIVVQPQPLGQSPQSQEQPLQIPLNLPTQPEALPLDVTPSKNSSSNYFPGE